MDWKEAVAHNKKVLDAIPIEKYMQPQQDVRELMEMLCDVYEKGTEDDPILKGDLFAELSVDEFGDYLHDRYKIPVYEEVIYNYIIGWYDKDGINS